MKIGFMACLYVAAITALPWFASSAIAGTLIIGTETNNQCQEVCRGLGRDCVRATYNNATGNCRIIGPEEVCDPSMNGKYTGLLSSCSVPADRATYGDTNEFGKFETNNPSYNYYGCTAPAKPAVSYWFYCYPNWYVWSDINKNKDYEGAGVGPSNLVVGNIARDECERLCAGISSERCGYEAATQNCHLYAIRGCEPTRQGKYSNLLSSCSVPGDRATYGIANDYGEYKTANPSYNYNGCTAPALPAVSYWVYCYPNWFVWGKVNP